MGITYKVELACQNSGLGYLDIIKRIQAVTHTRTQTALAEILEIRQSSISDAKRRQSVPGAWYMTLFEKAGREPRLAEKRHRPGVSAHRGRVHPRRR